MPPSRPSLRVAPARVFQGGRVLVESPEPIFPVDPFPRAAVGGVPAQVAFAASRRLALVVPPGVAGGPTTIELEGMGEIARLEVGRRLADELHMVDGPVFDEAGNLYVTFSGRRGEQVPVPVFRVRPDGTREPLALGLVNATSLAMDPYGELCVSSRFEGAVYRVKKDGTVEKFASDLGVACGLAFLPDGTMYVGDRSGTLFRVNAAGRVIPFATLPPSIAAFHLAIDEEEAVYVSGPTLSSCDPIYRVDRRGEVSIFAEGFGRPQGLAVGPDGALYVAEAMAGRSGIYRLEPRGRRELVAAGEGTIGLAFHPSRGVAVASGDAAYLFGAL